MSKTIIKAHSDASNVSIGAKTLTTSSVVLKKELSDDLTIKSGFSMIHEDMIVGLNKTLIIESNANLSVFDELLINGTVDVSGDVIIRSQYDDTEINNKIDSEVSDLKDPTALDNEAATRLGLKTYDISSYLNLNIGGTVSLAEAIPYQMQDGGWRLRLNIVITGTSSTTIHDLSINGVRWGGTAFQSGSASGNAAGGYSQTSSVNVDPASFVVRYSSNVNNTRVSGDFKLSQKPTWAY